jgi:hypothetical protein
MYKKLLSICFVLTFALTNVTIAQSNWKLIYENDKDGNVIQGEFNELILAIQNGETVRLFFTLGDKKKNMFVEHSAVSIFLTILNSPNGKVISAQIDPIVGQTPDFEAGQITLKENLEWSVIVSTSGKNDSMTRNVVTGEIVDHRILKWGTKWFVDRK